jgi:DNA-binding transcriptional ArsR family regulator
MANSVAVISGLDAMQALTHPVRIRVLEALRTPNSAAGVAREIGQSRQNVNYHLKELERAGLVRAAGERRRGNLLEPLYEAVAGSFVISPRTVWGDRRVAALRDQVSLERLVALGEGVQRDAAALLDRAAFDGEEIPSASVDANVNFPTEDARAAFMDEYLRMLGTLLKKHGARRGDHYRVVCATYPATDNQSERPRGGQPAEQRAWPERPGRRPRAEDEES